MFPSSTSARQIRVVGSNFRDTSIKAEQTAHSIVVNLIGPRIWMLSDACSHTPVVAQSKHAPVPTCLYGSQISEPLLFKAASDNTGPPSARRTARTNSSDMIGFMMFAWPSALPPGICGR